MQLPARLEPWRPWLSLFPADLAKPLGELLLRLHPHVGTLRSIPSRSDALPEGVGSIVARGQYERLLMTEWAIADAEPDEFVRRAGSGELMFTGPEPAARQRSRRCVALFDAGPAQLGEPRLLHLALFILLARRAEEAGAGFEWGVLQQPGTLRAEAGKTGLRMLLLKRLLAAVDSAAVEAWRGQIDVQQDDLWIIGAPRLPAAFPARAHVGIRRQLQSALLEVAISQSGAARAFTLALPASDVGIRLLRSPFEAVASSAAKHKAKGRPSLVLAPRFAAYGRGIAVPQLDGSVALYKVPSSVRSSPGKAARERAPASGSILAAGVFGKTFGAIVADGEQLRFTGFQSPVLRRSGRAVPRPPPEQFYSPPLTARWLPCFFLRHSRFEQSVLVEEVAVLSLDGKGNLGAWRCHATGPQGVAGASPIAFDLISIDVTGAMQFGETLVYAATRGEGTVFYHWSPSAGSTQIGHLPYPGSKVLFANAKSWSHPRTLGFGALQLDRASWLLFNGSTSLKLKLGQDVTVLGAAVSLPCNETALVIMRKSNSKTIELQTASERRIVIDSAEPIAQATVCPRSGDIAWIGATTRKLTVRGIDQQLPFLEVGVDEVSP